MRKTTVSEKCPKTTYVSSSRDESIWSKRGYDSDIEEKNGALFFKMSSRKLKSFPNLNKVLIILIMTTRKVLRS